MSKKKIVVGVVAVLVLSVMFWGVDKYGYKRGYKYGLSQCKPCPQSVVVQKKAKKPMVVKKKPQKKVAKSLLKKPFAAKKKSAKRVAQAPAVATTLTPTSALYTLRLNVVEWSPLFSGVPFSRDIGPLIRKGLTESSIKRASRPVVFEIEWFCAEGCLRRQTVVVCNGQAAISMCPNVIGPDTWVRVWSDTTFWSPPGGLPLVTNPGELYCQVKQGIKETYLHFILPPPLPPPPMF